jgi:hypothetical protein
MADAFDEFAQVRQRDREQRGKPPATSGDPELDRLCALVLATPPGRELLALLHKRVVERRVNPGGISDCALRAHAAEVQFVLQIEGATERGLAAMAKGRSA